MKPRYSLIIPAHNEEARIQRTLAEYAPIFADSEIIVVLNGCTDCTIDRVRASRRDFRNIEYVEIDHPVGKGGAVRAGFLVARSEIVGFVDADGATPATEMRRLFEHLGSTDALVGSRWIKGSKIHKAQPLKRRLASRAFNALVRTLFGLKLHDTQCGAKVFKAASLQAVMRTIETSNMAFDVDLLYSLKKAGYRIAEEPTEWTDIEGTRVRLFGASSIMLLALLRLRLHHSSFFHYAVPAFDRIFPTKPIRLHDGLSILILNWRDPRHPQSGGAETYLFEMAKHWARWGNRVEWVSAGFKGAARHDTLDGIRITRVGNAATVYAAVPWLYFRKLRNRFDVIVDTENGIPFFSPLFSMKPKICLVFHVHKRVFQQQLPWWISWLFVWLETWCMPRLYKRSQFVTISRTSLEEMEAHRFSQMPIEIVHSGVGVDCVPGLKSPTPIISYVGRLKRYKRVDALIEAFSRVRQEHPDARLVIAGAGDQEPNLRQLAAETGLGDAIEIRGYVSDAEKVEVLQQSWLFVSPSSMEGWGIAAIEANACGTPALAYDVPGLKEAIVDGLNGFTVPDGSDLSVPISRILRDEKLRRSLELGSIQRAGRFSWNRCADAFLDVIMRHVAGSSFSLVRLHDHWRLIVGAVRAQDAGALAASITLSAMANPDATPQYVATRNPSASDLLL